MKKVGKKILIFLIIIFIFNIFFMNNISADVLSEGELVNEDYPCMNSSKLLALKKNNEIYFLVECSESKGDHYLGRLSFLNKYGSIFSLGDIITVTGTIYEDVECAIGEETKNYICIDTIDINTPIANKTLKVTVKIDGDLVENIYLKVSGYGINKEGCTDSNGEWTTDLKPSDYYLEVPNYHNFRTIDVTSTSDNSITVKLSSDDLVENPNDYCNPASSSSENGGKSTPSFELIILLFAIAIIILSKRKRN